MSLVVKNLPANAGDTRLRFDPLQKEMAALSIILAWEKSYGQRSLAGYSPWGYKSLTQLSD